MKVKLEKTKRQSKKDDRKARKEGRKNKAKNNENFTIDELYQLINDRFDELEEKLLEK